jgi:hypothetical protein
VSPEVSPILQFKLDRTEEQCSDKKEEIALWEAKLHKLEADYKKEKERMKDKLRQKQMEFDSIQAEAGRMRYSLNLVLFPS